MIDNLQKKTLISIIRACSYIRDNTVHIHLNEQDLLGQQKHHFQNVLNALIVSLLKQCTYFRLSASMAWNKSRLSAHNLPRSGSVGWLLVWTSGIIFGSASRPTEAAQTQEGLSGRAEHSRDQRHFCKLCIGGIAG